MSLFHLKKVGKRLELSLGQQGRGSDGLGAHFRFNWEVRGQKLTVFVSS